MLYSFVGLRKNEKEMSFKYRGLLAWILVYVLYSHFPNTFDRLPIMNFNLRKVSIYGDFIKITLSSTNTSVTT